VRQFRRRRHLGLHRPAEHGWRAGREAGRCGRRRHGQAWRRGRAAPGRHVADRRRVRVGANRNGDDGVREDLARCCDFGVLGEALLAGDLEQDALEHRNDLGERHAMIIRVLEAAKGDIDQFRRYWLA